MSRSEILDDVVVVVEPASRMRRNGNAERRAATPSGSRERARPAAATAQAGQQQQQQEVEVVDLTSDSPGDVEIVSSSVRRASYRGVKRPRAALSPAKAALRTAAIQQREPQAPEPQSPRGPKCGICLESMGGNTGRAMSAGNCGHVYCRDCLTVAVRDTKKCPTCRKTLQVRQLHPVYISFE